jgi:hypothetical protein
MDLKCLVEDTALEERVHSDDNLEFRRATKYRRESSWLVGGSEGMEWCPSAGILFE